MKNIILIFTGIIGMLLITFGELSNQTVWGLLLLPLFYIGEPWYKSFSKK